MDKNNSPSYQAELLFAACNLLVLFISICRIFQCPIIHTGYLKNGNRQELKCAAERLKAQEEAYREMEVKFRNYYQMIELAKKTVQDGSMAEEETTLIQSIEQLILLLSDEFDFKIMRPKYEAMAIMLQEVVFNNDNDGEAKLVAVDAFLQKLEQPSSQLTHNLSTAFHLGNFALVLIIPLVNFYIMPLIPFSAALALLGLTGDLLVCATILLLYLWLNVLAHLRWYVCTS